MPRIEFNGADKEYVFHDVTLEFPESDDRTKTARYYKVAVSDSVIMEDGKPLEKTVAGWQLYFGKDKSLPSAGLLLNLVGIASEIDEPCEKKIAKRFLSGLNSDLRNGIQTSTIVKSTAEGCIIVDSLETLTRALSVPVPNWFNIQEVSSVSSAYQLFVNAITLTDNRRKFFPNF